MSSSNIEGTASDFATIPRFSSLTRPKLEKSREKTRISTVTGIMLSKPISKPSVIGLFDDKTQILNTKENLKMVNNSANFQVTIEV